jgi:hypothetical protein
MEDKEQVDLTEEVEETLDAMDDDQALAFFHELDKLAKTSALEKERVAVLNDRLDVYVLCPSLPELFLVTGRDPGKRRSVVAKVMDRGPSAMEAAEMVASAFGLRVISIHEL